MSPSLGNFVRGLQRKIWRALALDEISQLESGYREKGASIAGRNKNACSRKHCHEIDMISAVNGMLPFNEPLCLAMEYL